MKKGDCICIKGRNFFVDDYYKNGKGYCLEMIERIPEINIGKKGGEGYGYPEKTIRVYSGQSFFLDKKENFTIDEVL